MDKKTIVDLDVLNKKVLVRVDFNVPLKNGIIGDDTRIKEALPTINYLLNKGGAVILMSHLGRPDGQVMPEFSLKPVYDRLVQLMPNTKVYFANDVVGEDAREKSKNLKAGEVLLIENLRFEKGEEECDKDFCEKLASLGDVFVFDAFGTAHRKHASTYGVAKLLPNAIGFLIDKELKMICGNIQDPKRPFVAILGGAKISDKLNIVNSLIESANTIIIGGGMAFTFLKVMGKNVGNSLVDDAQLEMCGSALEKAKQKGVQILLPTDVMVAGDINAKEGEYLPNIDIPKNKMGLDIGKNTIKQYSKVIKKAKTVIWNGPMGVFENPAFANGTYKIAKAVAKSHAVSIVGGGDSASAIVNMGFEKKITHISTGGGASLKLLEGKVLPAVDIIENRIG